VQIRLPTLRAGGLRAFRFLVSSLVLFAAGAVQAAPPTRVCTDQILVDLVPRARIAAVTHLATDPLTAAHPERATGISSTKGAAEDVLAHNPDLIIAGAYTTPATVALLRRVGRRVEVMPQPQTIAGVRALIRAMATVVEAPTQGEALIASMDARLNHATATPNADRPVALVYQVNNYVSASGSLIDEAMVAAGFRNGAAALAAGRNGQVSLEALLRAPPDLLILASGPTTYRTAVGDNLRHPALKALAASVPTTVVPWPVWLCGTHHIADAVEKLARLRR
jgi:iron complex transport system substrate-binding protein